MIDILFLNLRKALVATIALMFAFVVVYTPQDFASKKTVPDAEAIFGIVHDPIHTGATIAGTVAQAGVIIKETILDGIAWAIAKQIIANMVADLVDWINSGFKGSPAFITNFESYLLEAVDQQVGKYIQELGGDLSFLCDPFKLDIQLALTNDYDRMREQKPYEGCTLSDIVGNVEDFISGDFVQINTNIQSRDTTFVTEANREFEAAWDNWLTVTSQPEKYTPYGSYLAAQRVLEAQAAAAKANETIQANWGSGMKSSKICETVDNGTNRLSLRCSIVTPARQISDALSKKLGLSDDTLVTADEISEVIGALITQLAKKAISGTAGLLGLSGRTGYTYNNYNGGSYLGAVRSEASGSGSRNVSKGLGMLEDSLQVQLDMKALADRQIPILQNYIANPRNPQDARDFASSALSDAQKASVDAPKYAATLKDMIADYKKFSAEYADPATPPDVAGELTQQMADIISYLNQLAPYTKSELEGNTTTWNPTTYR
jgi:hypothetical protein